MRGKEAASVLWRQGERRVRSASLRRAASQAVAPDWRSAGAPLAPTFVRNVKTASEGCLCVVLVVWRMRRGARVEIPRT